MELLRLGVGDWGLGGRKGSGDSQGRVVIHVDCGLEILCEVCGGGVTGFQFEEGQGRINTVSNDS